MLQHSPSAIAGTLQNINDASRVFHAANFGQEISLVWKLTAILPFIIAEVHIKRQTDLRMQLSVRCKRDSRMFESFESCTVSASSTRDNSLAVCFTPRLEPELVIELNASRADRLKSGCCKASSFGSISLSCTDAGPASPTLGYAHESNQLIYFEVVKLYKD